MTTKHLMNIWKFFMSNVPLWSTKDSKDFDKNPFHHHHRWCLFVSRAHLEQWNNLHDSLSGINFVVKILQVVTFHPIVNRPLCCSFSLSNFTSPVTQKEKNSFNPFVVRTLKIDFQTLPSSIDGTRIILNIYITQKRVQSEAMSGIFLYIALTARITSLSLSLLFLQAYLLMELWFICSCFVCTKCVWIIAYRAHVAPSTILCRPFFESI